MPRNKIPWPTQKAMSQIYERQLWGSNQKDKFYSGEGSHKKEITDNYLKVVKEFLGQFKPKLYVCDLGCGDFNIGKQLVIYSKKYTAIDIVPELIAYNKEKLSALFDEKQLDFQCLDISKDELPKADCLILRQVLQHLSNNEVLQITKKLQSYQYIILTEHIPSEKFIPNIDIISGQGIRLKKNSGIDLLEEPFNLKVIKSQTIDTVNLYPKKGKIVTQIYKLF